MSTYPTALIKTSIRHLFASPLILSELPPDVIADINPKLTELLLRKEQEMPSQTASNLGGWQSDDKILHWGGDEVKIIVAALRQLIDQITVHFDQTGVHRGDLEWKVNGWGNINRANGSNMAHIHPGAYWTAAYYIATGHEDQGGKFQIFDPRGGLPLMYAPTLRVGLEGYMTAGNSELHSPREGQCILFPSWLSHAVTPYTGEGTRISLAFNFSL